MVTENKDVQATPHLKEDVRYWRLGTRKGERGPSQFNLMEEGGYISIGYGNVDFSDITNDDKGKNLLRDRIKNAYRQDRLKTEELNNIFNNIFKFIYELKKSDIIVACDGENAVGIGTNLGNYYYKEDSPNNTVWPNRRSIDWINFDQIKIPIRGTLREIHQPEIISEIRKRIGGDGRTRDTIGHLMKLLECRHQIILAGPPGTSKTYNALNIIFFLGGGNSEAKKDVWRELNQNQFRQLEPDLEKFDGIKVIWDIVQFHQSYGYEDFVSGIEANSENGTLNFDRKRRIFLQMVEAARKNPEIKFVLIIDEINRGILGRIFGELIMTLEYRDLAVRLSGQDERISIPNNMYLIGTMNTADRNISLVDHALRRRFLIVECLPDKTLLEEYLKSHFDSNIQSVSIVSNIFEAVQEAFYRDGLKEYERDSRGYSLGDYAIGHTYFMVQNLESLWISLRYQIIPLMEEYRKEGILTDELLKRTADHIRRLNLNLNQNDANAKWLENWCLTIIGQQ
jgi:hypothetical protein